MKRGRRTEPIGLAPFLAAMPRQAPSASRSRRDTQYTVPSTVCERSRPAYEGGVSPITSLPATEKRTPPSAVLRRRVALAFAAFVLIGATDGATGVLLPSLQTHYGVGKSVVSLLFVALTVGYIVAAFGSGLLVALLGERRFLALGAAAFALGAFVVSLRPPFALVLLTMVGFGFGFAIIDAGLNAYITAMPESTTQIEQSARLLRHRRVPRPDHRCGHPDARVRMEYCLCALVCVRAPSCGRLRAPLRCWPGERPATRHESGGDEPAHRHSSPAAGLAGGDLHALLCRRGDQHRQLEFQLPHRSTPSRQPALRLVGERLLVGNHPRAADAGPARRAPRDRQIRRSSAIA